MSRWFWARPEPPIHEIQLIHGLENFRCVKLSIQCSFDSIKACLRGRGYDTHLSVVCSVHLVTGQGGRVLQQEMQAAEDAVHEIKRDPSE